MLRISAPIEADGRLTMRLDGDISGAWVGVLDDECRRAQAGSGAALELDLTHVPYVDHAGRALLRRLAGAGVALRNCPPLIEALLREEAAE